MKQLNRDIFTSAISELVDLQSRCSWDQLYKAFSVESKKELIDKMISNNIKESVVKVCYIMRLPVQHFRDFYLFLEEQH